MPNNSNSKINILQYCFDLEEKVAVDHIHEIVVVDPETAIVINVIKTRKEINIKIMIQIKYGKSIQNESKFYVFLLIAKLNSKY